MRTFFKFTFIATLSVIFSFLNAGAQKYTISGTVKDAGNGESLIGVNVYVKNTTTGIISNSYGFYSLTLSEGKYTLVVSYLGYNTIDTLIDLNSNITMNFQLPESVQTLEQVEIKGTRTRNDISSTSMGLVTLSSKTIKQMPVAYGEVDLIKTLSLLPGVKTNDEGSSLSVRGGARDQNLILLDEATVYNASHLGNLLSIFNNDAIQNVEFYKGNIPAQYGGRLSSLIDIRMREGNNKHFSASGGIGTLSTRLTIEGPLVKNKGSFIISGRRAYIDLLTKAIHHVADTFPVVPYYFYDLNLKANYNLNKKNRLFISGYFGKDVFSMETEDKTFVSDFAWGNYTGTIRWNFIPSNKVFTNLTLLVSNYNYNFGNSLIYGKQKTKREFNWNAFLIDYSMKYDVGIYLNENVTLKTGLISTYHDFNPGKINSKIDTLAYRFKMPVNNALEHAVYINCDQKLSSSLTLSYGFRYVLFQNIGKATVYKLNSEFITVDTLHYARGDIFNFYQSPEPRLAFTCVLDQNSSVKLGYSRTSQFVHIASNSSTSTILDLWVGSGKNIKPQLADLFSAGYFRNFAHNKIEGSIEVYYKKMKNQIEFREFAEPQFNPRMDEDFRFGVGRAYGMELMIKKTEGRLSGWISYSLSRSERKIDNIQQKGWFISSFDRTHDLTLVGVYNLSKRIVLSSNFLLKSGRPFTSPVVRYTYDGVVLPYYPKRNNDRMTLYQRLDISLTLNSKEKPNRKFHSETVLSIYDVLNKVNPISIYFKPDDDNENITRAYKQNFLGFMPSLAWNFYF